MKKYIFALFIMFTPFAVNSTPAILAVEAETGKVLVRQNENIENYPASITKLMTLYITFAALEQGLLNWDDKLYVSSHASRQPKSKLYMKKGDTITVEQAVKTMIVISANDSAVVLAEAMAGTESDFAIIMNKFAKELELNNTSFSKASGLTEDGYKSTASDLVRLSMAIMKHFPDEYKLFSLKGYKFKNKVMGTTNNILRYYKGADGLKTGYTNKAGYNLVSTAKNKNGRIIAITMDQRSVKLRDRSMTRLLNQGFQRLAKQKEEIESLEPIEIPKIYIDTDTMITEHIKYSKSLAEMPEEERRKLIIMNDGGGDWGVQVGAYYKNNQAMSAAKKVSKKYLEDDFPRKEYVKTTKTKRGKTVYNSIIGGLSQHNAYEICVNYKKCFIVKPSKVTKVSVKK